MAVLKIAKKNLFFKEEIIDLEDEQNPEKELLYELNLDGVEETTETQIDDFLKEFPDFEYGGTYPSDENDEFVVVSFNPQGKPTGKSSSGVKVEDVKKYLKIV